MLRAPKFAVLAVLAVAMVAALGAASGAVAASSLRASMNGNREVPKGDRDGRGSARVTTNRAKGQVCFSIRLSKVGKVMAGHIHKGAPGVAGPIVVQLFSQPTRKPRGCVSDVSKSLISDIQRHPGRYYVNVHNKRYPAGAVRGQLHG